MAGRLYRTEADALGSPCLFDEAILPQGRAQKSRTPRPWPDHGTRRAKTPSVSGKARSVQTGDLELVTHSVAQSGLAAVGQRQGCAVGGMQCEKIDARGDALHRREHLLGLIGCHDLD